MQLQGVMLARKLRLLYVPYLLPFTHYDGGRTGLRWNVSSRETIPSAQIIRFFQFIASKLASAYAPVFNSLRLAHYPRVSAIDSCRPTSGS